MDEYLCFQCQKRFNIAGTSPAPTQCPFCKSKDIAKVTIMTGPSIEGATLNMGIASILLGPFMGLPAIVLGCVALANGTTKRTKTIVGIVAGFVGTALLTGAAAWFGFSEYQSANRASCLLNMSQLAIAQVKQPEMLATTSPAYSVAAASTMPAAGDQKNSKPAVAAITPATLPAEAPANASKTPATAPAKLVSYKTNWPMDLDQAARKSPKFAIKCPKSGKAYFYMPPAADASPMTFVLADTAEEHSGRCVLRASGEAECLSEDQFNKELEKPYNAMFAEELKFAGKPKETKAASQPATQPAAATPATAPAK